ncbi:MAG: DNA polymerase III subunit delta [Spirochaetales bacterium]|jgi:DNA polymerase-3 subunit delta|nr:DNA polymerase III subunit delta [Spirochaetales bacterium]
MNKKKLEPLYLLLGPETGNKNTFIADIRGTLTQETGEAPEEYHFYAFETSLQEVVAILRNASLFASRKLVLVSCAEDIRKKDEITLLTGYAKNPSKNSVLIFMSDGFQVDKKISDCVGAKGVQKFWEMFNDKKEGWVRNCFQRRKVTLGPGAAELFLEMVENTTLEMERECAGLCFFKGENSEVTCADIETYLYHSRQETVFSLFQTVCALDLEMSLEILDKLLLEGESGPVQLLSVLLWQFKNLLTYIRLLELNTPPDEAFARLNIKQPSRPMYREGAKNFSQRQLESILVLFADFDEELRSGGGKETQARLMEFFLYSIICRKGLNFLKNEQDGV